MQLAMIEFARNIANIKKATSMEFDKDGEFIVHYMEGQSKEISKGGSMRLGAYDCTIEKGSLAYEIYKETNISERHRHRLEVNNEFTDKLKEAGMVISGTNKKLNLVEVIELGEHPFFIACQYHPEFKSRPFNPHPLFRTFVEAALKTHKDN
jgi:CTP synthase